jgi:hypothetical protein
LPEEDVYRCPAGERLPYRYTNEEDGKTLRRYWTTACQTCPLKSKCTPVPERRITRWEHEHLLEAVQQRLDANPKAMRQRRETVEHPFGTMNARMEATHSTGGSLSGDVEGPLASMRIAAVLHPAVLLAFADRARFLQHGDRPAAQRPDRRSSLPLISFESLLSGTKPSRPFAVPRG